MISSLCSIGEVEILKEGEVKGVPMSVVDNSTRVYSHLKGIINPQTEIARLKKKQGELQKVLDGVEKKIADKHFETKTPEEVKKKTLAKKESLIEEIRLIELAQKELAEME